MRSAGLFTRNASKPFCKSFCKKVDAKLGKGFCAATKAAAFSPVFRMRLSNEMCKTIAEEASFRGVHGPMRANGRLSYADKCDQYIALFDRMISPIVDLDDRVKHQERLYRMVDDGMFANLNYEQFVWQLRTQFLAMPVFPRVNAKYLDAFLNDPIIQGDMRALWVK